VGAARGFTERQIQDLPLASGRQRVTWDGRIPGFGVRVSARTKTYVLKYRLRSGRVRWKTLGRVGTLTLDQARRRAKRDLGLVADGVDPLARRDHDRDASTVADVADRFLSDHVDVRLKPASRRLYRLAIDGHVRPQLGAVAITEVSSAHLQKLHHRLRATPYLANRVIAVTSKFLRWAAHAGYRGPGPHPNPREGLRPFREQPRRRYLTSAELRRLGAALRVGARYGRVPPAAAAAIKLLVLTGARVSEILSLRRADVDLAARVLRLGDSKTGPKVIWLNPPALAVLEAWPIFAGSDYVFPGEGHGRRRGTHRVSLHDAWRWLCRRARLRDARLHDLRHSFASIAVSSGQTLPVIGALLGHSQPATTARYAHLMDDPLRRASEATAPAIAAGLDGGS
jgi:integrase